MVERELLPDDVAKQIAGMGYIKSYFPIKIGRGRFTNFSVTCPFCGESVGIDRLKGEMKVWAETVSLMGFGACGKCKTWMPFDVKLREDGSILAKNGDIWQETSAKRSGGFLSSLKRFFGVAP